MKTASEKRVAALLPTLKMPGKGMVTIYFCLSLFAIFYIPYFFSVWPSTSDSYIFGYNNRVGVVLLIILASVGAIWTQGFNLNFSTVGPSPKLSLKYLGMALVIELSACLSMYFIAGRSRVSSEAEQQINRVWLTSLGKRPYIDFEWPWGPFFLHGPRWISGWLHLTIPQAYFIFWILTSLLGIALLYTTINLVEFPSTHKTCIFFLFFCFAMLSILNMGTNYTLVRYLCPTAFVLLVYRTRGPRPLTSVQLRASALCIMFTAILLMISPEVTVAFALASTMLLFPGRFSSTRRIVILAYGATITTLALIFFFAFKAHFLDGLIMDSHGGNSLPIIICPAILLFFGAVFICACYAVQRNSNDGIRDNTVALIAFAVPMLAAALGRADPGHIVLNGIGFFIAAFFYASNSRRIWRFCRNAFILVFLALGPFPWLLLTVYSFTKPPPPRFPKDADISDFYPKEMRSFDHGVFEAPFGYVPDASGYYFSGQIDYGFYDGLWDATTPDSYRVKIKELTQHPRRALLIRHGVFGACKVYDSNARITISMLMTFPYTATEVHRESVRKPLCDYILDHYALAVPGSAQNFEYELWTPGSKKESLGPPSDSTPEPPSGRL